MDLSDKNLGLYEKIIDNSRELIILFDEMGHILLNNLTARKETGYTEGMELLNISDIYPMAIHALRGKVSWDEPTINLQSFAYRKNKTCFPVKLTCSWLLNMPERIGIAYGIDDSERYNAVRSHQKAMNEVQEATKTKNEFTANITHELRTPINGIKGMVESLRDTQLTPEQEETIGIVIKCCDNMTSIINDLLDFAKMEAGKLSIEEQEFNFRRFLDDILTFNAVRINEKGLKLIVDVASNIPEVLIGDELRIGQVLNNLFSNAIKFTSVGHIGLEVANTYISENEIELFFVVIDTGIGISPSDKDKLFQSFSQVDGTITRRFGGTGLGLAICRQLVSLMHGSIRVDSEKGRGSTFSFTVRVGVGKGSKDRTAFKAGRYEYNRSPGIMHSSVNVQETLDRLDVSDEPADTGRHESTQESIDLFEQESKEAENLRNINELLEKIRICIDLGAWEKAENFATVVKNLAPQEDKEWKTSAFSLLLSVRKENYSKSEEIIEQLQSMLD